MNKTYTIAELAQELRISEYKVMTWLKKNGKYKGDSGYSEDTLKEMKIAFTKERKRHSLLDDILPDVPEDNQKDDPSDDGLDL